MPRTPPSAALPNHPHMRSGSIDSSGPRLLNARAAARRGKPRGAHQCLQAGQMILRSISLDAPRGYSRGCHVAESAPCTPLPRALATPLHIFRAGGGVLGQGASAGARAARVPINAAATAHLHTAGSHPRQRPLRRDTPPHAPQTRTRRCFTARNPLARRGRGRGARGVAF